MFQVQIQNVSKIQQCKNVICKMMYYVYLHVAIVQVTSDEQSNLSPLNSSSMRT